MNRSKTGFTGGSPSPTTAGTAADATALFSAATTFSATPGRWFVSCNNSSPYNWTAYAITLGGGNVLTFLADEALTTGTTAAEDTDPYLWLGYYNATGLAVGAFQCHGSSALIGYKRYPSASNIRISYGSISDFGQGLAAPAQNTTTGQLGPTPTGVREVPLLIPVYKNVAAASSSGWAGYTAGHRWSTVGGRANGDTLSTGSDFFIYASGVWVPWDSSTPSLS